MYRFLSTCFNGKPFSGGGGECGLCRQVVTKAGLTLPTYSICISLIFVDRYFESLSIDS